MLPLSQNLVNFYNANDCSDVVMKSGVYYYKECNNVDKCINDKLKKQSSIYANANNQAMGKREFYCPTLSDIDCDNITHIEDFAFEFCNNLSKISFPKATSIGMNAFNCCFKLTAISLTEIILIKNLAFNNCISLTEIILGPILPTLGAEAFGGIDLTNVTLYVPAFSIEAYKKHSVFGEMNIIAIPQPFIKNINVKEVG